MRKIGKRDLMLAVVPVALAVTALASLTAAALRRPELRTAEGSFAPVAAGDDDPRDGALLGRRLAELEARRRDETAALRTALAAAEARLHALTRGARCDAGPRRVAPAGPDLADSADRALARGGTEGGLAAASELVAAIEAVLLVPDGLGDRHVLDELGDRLTAELRMNPAALDSVLERLRAAAGTDLGGVLAVSLGQVKHPAVEAAAVELARSPGSEALRLAGLELLQRLDLPSAETRRTVVDVLGGDGSPEVLGSALYALHRGVPTPAETREALASVIPLTRNADPEVRRRAVIAAADWAADEAGLAPAVRALADPSPDVRSGAAYALGRSRVASPAAVQALVQRVQDEREDFAVREQAWRALSRYPLDDRAHAAYASFEAVLEAAGEAAAGASPEPDRG